MGHTRMSGLNITRVFRITVVLALLALAAVAAGCGSEASVEEDKTRSSTGSRTTTGPKEATDEYVKKLAVRRIGDPDLVRTAQVTTGAEGGKDILIEIGRPYTCHDGAVVGEVALFTQQTMGLLFKDPAVQKISITMYGVTLEPGDTDSVAMTLMVDRAVADTIDWFSFDHTNMLRLVNAYYLDPAIEQSFINEGGSTEGTRSDLENPGATP